jgi:hypothetical protein
MIRRIALMLITIAIAFTLTACGNDANKPNDSETKLQDPEYAGLGEWAVKVDGQSVVQSIKSQGEEKTEQGYVFVKVDITARNNTDQDRSFMLGMLAPELEDAKGNKSQYEMFVEGALDKEDCKAGMTVSGSIFFKMPGDINLVTTGMKLAMTYLGQREQPKAEIILK